MHSIIMHTKRLIEQKVNQNKQHFPRENFMYVKNFIYARGKMTTKKIRLQSEILESN